MRIKNEIIHGDCTQILKRIKEGTISACITDPPYNYEFIGKDWNHYETTRRIDNTKNSKTLVKNIPYGSGLAGGVRNKNWYKRYQENIDKYTNWCYEWSKELYRITKPGSPILVFNSNRTIAHVQTSLERAGFYARDIIIYRRPSGIPKGYNGASQLKRKGLKDWKKWEGWHSCLRNEWEGIVVVQKPLSNNYTETIEKYDLGLFNTENDNDGFLTNIFENISKDKKEVFNVHCTVKPLALMEKLISVFVPKGKDHIVLDPFAGSGTTLVAAKKLDRSFVGIEIEEEYVKIIKKRLDKTQKSLF